MIFYSFGQGLLCPKMVWEINVKSGGVMKILIILSALAMCTIAFAQSSADGLGTEVCSYSGEDIFNAGGKVSIRVGNSDYYSGLVQFDLTGKTLMLPCTLFLKQHAFTSGDVYYDRDSGTFNTTISSVYGTWANGSADVAVQAGSVCYKYRAYSATAPVNWVSGSTSSTVESVSKGQAGSHVNSVGMTLHMMTSGLLCYAVLDSQILVDLVNGFGGLRVSKATGQSGEIRFKNDTNIKLRWNPSGTPIAVEKGAVVSRMMLAASSYPNPSNLSIVIRYTSRTTALPVQVFGINGALLRTLQGANGMAVWDGCDNLGRVLADGVYVYRITEAGKTVQGRMVISK